MKLLLSITITLKDYIPKDKYIPFENYLCIISHNNFNGKIHLSNLQNQNFIKHKIELCDESNIVYNLHMLDSLKSSLIGIYQIIINFDKIKNLNINDTLTQEESAKLIIDPKTKRKIFDKIMNMGDIYLNLSIEIKVLDKKYYSSGNKINSNLIRKGGNVENNEQVSEFNLTPETFKKKQVIKSMKSIKEASRRIDTISSLNENNMTDYIRDENDLTFMQGSTIKKYKSLNKAKIIAQNNKFNELSINNNNQNFNNSCTVMMSPKNHSAKVNLKNESRTKTNKRKKPAPMKKVTILNLMEQKMDSSIYKQKEDNLFELSTQPKNFKNTSINFTRCLKNNYKKNSFCSLNKKNQNSIKKINVNHFDETDFFQKKNYQNINKIYVNLSGKNKIEKTVSESKNKLKNHKIKLDVFEMKRLNTEISKEEFKKNLSNYHQIDNSIKRLTDRKKDTKNNIITDNDLRKLIEEKGNLIKEKFDNNYFTEKGRGTFSPKLSLRIKFNESIAICNEKSDINSLRFKERFKENINNKILTPKGNQIRTVILSNEENLRSENEELRKKCFNLIDFYSLLTKKLKKTCENNIEYIKKIEIIKEKLNNLKKYKYKIIQIQNFNDTKKIKNHVLTHYKEEQLLNKMINIKLKENSIYQNIFENVSDEQFLRDRIKILFSQKKEILVNLIKNIVKYYGNISQIYNNHRVKKNLLLNLFDKYEIKEKIKIDLNYINYIHKDNNFKDKIITEVDEEKENEEEDNEKIIKINNSIIKKEINNNNIIDLNIQNKENNKCFNNNNNNNITINNNTNNIEHEPIIKNINNNNKNITINNNINNIEHEKIIKNNNNNNNKNKIQEIRIINVKKLLNKKKLENKYDENLNNLIRKILLEQFPRNYKTNGKFIHKEKNKYMFNNRTFYAYIENNDVMLKEEINNCIDDNKFTLNEFYKRFCIIEKTVERPNFVYTKKIRQKYIKIKNNENEQIFEKISKNENSTTIETENKQNSINSRVNENND